MQLVDFAIRRRVTVAMATVAVTLLGLISLARLKVSLLPELSYPTLTIRTELPGAAPPEVENLITRPIEEAVGVVRNVRTVRSVSRSGQSDVVLEFLWGTDMDFAGIDVRERLDLLQLPADAGRPLLLRFDPSSEPVLRLALVQAPGAAEQRLDVLRRFAEDRLKPELEAIEGSAAVKVSGGLEDEIHVYADQERLAQLGLAVQQIARRLGAENVNLSGGRLEQGRQRFLVRTVNEFESLEAMADAVIATIGGRPVRLRDVARIERNYKDRTAITRLDGRECVELAVYKEGDANTVQLAGRVHARLQSLRNSLPPGAELVVVYDQARFIADAISEVREAALWGGLLAVLVLYWFLRDARATVVTGIVIPVTVMGIFVLMYSFDLTLNIMSLGGIALSIGMLVDNAVVILESIARKREAGLPPLEAARAGTSEVAMAVTASTLTSVAVFFPMVFVAGMAGQLFRDQALTVTFAQLLSLLVGLTLVPMLAATRRAHEPPSRPSPASAGPAVRSIGDCAAALLKAICALPSRLRVGAPAACTAGSGTIRLIVRWSVLVTIRLIRSVADIVAKALALALAPGVSATSIAFGALERRYPAMLAWSLAHRGLVLTLVTCAFALTLAILPSLRTELIPQLAQGELSVKLRLEPGTPLETTDRAVQAAQRSAAGIEGLEHIYSVAGTGNRLDANPVDAGENTATLDVRLRSPAGPADEERVVRSLREQLASLPGVQYELGRPALFSLATPIEVVLSGHDLDRLREAAVMVRERMETTGAFRDIRSTIESGHPEIQVLFDQERASQLGLAVRDIADRVVAGVRGDVATRYRWLDKKIDVLVRSVDTREASIEEVRNLIVNPDSDRPVPLSAVADVRLAVGPAEIRRADQERVAVISADAAHGDLGTATAVARDILARTPLPAGITGDVSGQSEEMQESFRSLTLAFGLAVFLVYLVMASQFESLLHPFVILLTIPMGLIGAVWGLFLTDTTLNAVALIGLIMLAGIVVNNAIVLVDAINRARERGLAKAEAIVEAGRARLRPIVITSVSTILGLLPMVLGFGEGAEIRRPMAVTAIGGMIVATFLTLIVIPVLYSVLDRKRFSSAEAPAGMQISRSVP